MGVTCTVMGVGVDILVKERPEQRQQSTVDSGLANSPLWLEERSDTGVTLV